MEKIKISLYEIVNDPFCVSAEDGEKVFEQIKKIFLADKKIDISFLNVKMVTSAFLNTAIGKLYGQFEEQEIKERFSLSDISNSDKLLLKRVITTAKAYYKNPNQFEESIDKIMAEQ